MSHFSVLVAIPGEQLQGSNIDNYMIDSCLTDIMAPYDEASEDPRFRCFEDATEQYMEEYQADTGDFARLADGTVCVIHDSRFTRKFVLKDGKVYCAPKNRNDPLVESEESKAVVYLPKQPVKDYYSFDAYCSDYYGYTKNEDGRWGYYHNPNAKWDWYQIGGRFSGPMLAEKGTYGALVTEDEKGAPLSYGHYDMIDGCFKKDIAWDAMHDRSTKAAKARFAELEKAFQCRRASNLGPLCSIQDDGIHGWNGELLYVAGETLEQYLDRRGMNEESAGGFFPYAYVDRDGVWQGQGEMHWWAITSGDKPDNEWHSEVNTFIESLKDTDYLVLLDCHI